ncbi:calcium-binding protein [Streptomyces sp. NPDC050803]|uniref:calcium-binding protein n=1 Tax=unclassified Streptomyces TaxID=2593676 RepID=UPI00344A285A
MSTLLSRLCTAAVCAFGLVVATPGGALAAPGDLDPSFGDGGKVYVYNGLVSTGYDLALQSDDKIVTVGLSQDAGWLTTDFSVMRHHTDGSIDTSFGTGGEVLTDFDGAEDYANAVVVQGDGRIVVAGSSNYAFALARYNPDGSPDTGFGTDGRLTTDLGGPSEVQAVAVQSDGKIVAAGRAGGAFAVARYLPDGGLDPAFGDGGLVTTSFEAGGAAGQDLALQPDGRIVVAGRAGTSGSDFALARYNTDGSLDTGFGTGGRVTTAFAGEEEVRGVAVQPDGRIVAAGRTGFDVALARYNPDGTLDSGFGTGGRVTTDFGGTLEAAHDLVLQPDGKIVTGGVRSTDFNLVRYNTDGSLDSGFGSGGRASADFTYYDEIFGVALQDDGNIVTFGSSGDDRGLVRFLGGTATPPPPGVDLSVTKSGTATVSIGDRATYTVTVTNTSTTIAATGVSLTDTLTGPAGTVISATPSQGTCTTAVSCTLGTLAPGAQATVTVVAEPRATGTLTQQATVSATQTDPTTGNNTATVTTTVNNARGCTRIGTSGNDTITGTYGADVICGLGGDDSINASYGYDTVYGGYGNDSLNGSFHDDTLNGGPGNDNLIGSYGNDRLNTVDNVSGNDTANGGYGSDTCTTDTGDTRISCP